MQSWQEAGEIQPEGADDSAHIYGGTSPHTGPTGHKYDVWAGEVIRETYQPGMLEAVGCPLQHLMLLEMGLPA